MTDGAQQSGQPSSAGSHGDGTWRYVVAPALVSVLTGLFYQLHGCGSDSPGPTPTSTVTETMSDDTQESDSAVPSTPSVSADITRIVYRGADSGNAAYADIEVDTDISGLRGQECVIKWSTYYPYTNGEQGGTNTGYSGQRSTGLLAYDDTVSSATLAVRAQQSGWRVHIFVYGPDGTLLDQQDGPTG